MTVHCEWCDQDMNESCYRGCTGNTKIIYPDVTILFSVPANATDGPNGHCSDCYVPHGMPHHPGCSKERCPKCGGQIISCGCLVNMDLTGGLG
jgi:hypothetical protein